MVPDVAYLEQKDGRVAQGWAAAQAATTADFAHGSWLWTHISGGLNHQVGVSRSCVPLMCCLGGFQPSGCWPGSAEHRAACRPALLVSSRF